MNYERAQAILLFVIAFLNNKADSEIKIILIAHLRLKVYFDSVLK